MIIDETTNGGRSCNANKPAYSTFLRTKHVSMTGPSGYIYLNSVYR